MGEEEAQIFLSEFGIKSLENKKIDFLTELNSIEDIENHNLEQNKRILVEADNFILERLQAKDPSLKLSEILGAKDTAFKQMRQILGKDDGENRNLIPANINIQVINNY